MKTPKHWQTDNLLARILYPLGCLYALATFLRLKLIKPQKINVSVVCIGNLTAGGSGKTPVAISVAKMLKSRGKNPFFISRGYGGKLCDVLINPKIHQPHEVGDEPLLLAEAASVVVNYKRVEAAQKAVNNGADIIIMDDGFQNPKLFKDKSLLVIDGSVGLGNMMPIPAGPMREFMQQGIKRANAVVLLGEDKTGILAKINNLPVFRGTIEPVKPSFTKQNIIAFAGIGRPQKFYQTLKECGANIVKAFDFADHHFYTVTELNSLINEAKKLDAEIFTTTKDWVKIPVELRKHFNVLEITVKWQDEDAIKEFLLN